MGDFQGHPFRGNQWTDNPAHESASGVGTPDAPSADISDTAKEVRSLVGMGDGIRRLGNNDPNAALIFKVARQQEGDALLALGVRTLSTQITRIDGNDLHNHAADVAEVSAMYYVHSAILALPEATREQILEKGIEVRIKSYEKTDDIIANGQTYVPGGFYQRYAAGAGIVTLVSHPTLRPSGPDPKDNTWVPNSINMGLIGHEFGHVSTAVSEAIDAERNRGWKGGDDWAEANDTRQSMSEIISTYEAGARDYERAAGRAELAGDSVQAVALRSEALKYSSWSEGMRADAESLKPIVNALYNQAQRSGDFAREHKEALGKLITAVNAEGGVTEYADRWHKDTIYGMPGAAPGAVHRGVDESIAEIEGHYLKAVAGQGTTAKEFAKHMAEGTVTKVARPWNDIHDARPKTAKAWLSWRTVMEKGNSVKSRTRSGLSQAQKDLKKKLVYSKDYWTGLHDRIKTDISAGLARETMRVAGRP